MNQDKYIRLSERLCCASAFLFLIGCSVRSVEAFSLERDAWTREFTPLMLWIQKGSPFLIAIGCLGVTACICLLQIVSSEIRVRNVGKCYSLLTFLVFHVFVGIRIAIDEPAPFRLAAIGLAFWFTFTTCWAANRCIKSIEFLSICKRYFLCFVVVYGALVIFEAIANPEACYHSSTNRWYGLDAGPTFLGTHAAMLISILWSLKLVRYIKYPLICVGLLAIVCNGSRGGVVVLFAFFACKMFLLLLDRPKRLVVYSMAVAFLLPLVFLCIELIPGDSRLVSTEDTRSEAWGQLMADIEAAPIIGKGILVQDSENSFLLAFAIAGLFGFIPLLAHLAVFSMQVATSFARTHRYSGGFIGFWVPILSSVFVHSFLDGDLVDSIRLPVLIWWVGIACIDTCLITPISFSE